MKNAFRILVLFSAVVMLLFSLSMLVACHSKSGSGESDDDDDDTYTVVAPTKIFDCSTETVPSRYFEEEIIEPWITPGRDYRCRYDQCETHWYSQPSQACSLVMYNGESLWSLCSTPSGISHFCAECYARDADLCGITDWRLPTITELSLLWWLDVERKTRDGETVVHIIAPFELVDASVWTQRYVEWEDDDVGLLRRAWLYDFSTGGVYDVWGDTEAGQVVLLVKRLR